MEVLRALATVLNRPAEVPGELCDLLDLPGTPEAAVHTELFTLELPPYASVYVGEEGMLGGEARDRVAGFFRALSVLPPPEPDHLAVLLHAMADLSEAEAGAEGEDGVARYRRARAALLREHVLPWLPVYLGAVATRAPEPYRSWALTLEGVLRHLVAELGAGDAPPVHFAVTNGLPDPRHVPDADLVGALLAPGRSGVILTRSDLAQGARELGLALRIGERRYVLRQLLDQDAPSLLGWLARKAQHAADRYERELAWTGPSGRCWHRRADTGATLLAELADQATQALTDSLVSRRGGA